MSEASHGFRVHSAWHKRSCLLLLLPFYRAHPHVSSEQQSALHNTLLLSQQSKYFAWPVSFRGNWRSTWGMEYISVLHTALSMWAMELIKFQSLKSSPRKTWFRTDERDEANHSAFYIQSSLNQSDGKAMSLFLSSSAFACTDWGLEFVKCFIAVYINSSKSSGYFACHQDSQWQIYVLLTEWIFVLYVVFSTPLWKFRRSMRSWN
jgi:hypothetical protein